MSGLCGTRATASTDGDARTRLIADSCNEQVLLPTQPMSCVMDCLQSGGSHRSSNSDLGCMLGCRNSGPTRVGQAVSNLTERAAGGIMTGGG